MRLEVMKVMNRSSKKGTPMRRLDAVLLAHSSRI